jgi:ribosome-associated translation inhibitor RaiA
MEIPLSIDARNTEVPPPVEALIQRKAEWLERFFKPVIRCEVAVAGPGRHHRSGGLFEVRLGITVPGGLVMVDRQQNARLDTAVRQAFDVARRQLEELDRRRRGEVKTHAEPLRTRETTQELQEGNAA